MGNRKGKLEERSRNPRKKAQNPPHFLRFSVFRRAIARAFPYFPGFRFSKKEECRKCGPAILELASARFLFPLTRGSNIMLFLSSRSTQRSRLGFVRAFPHFPVPRFQRKGCRGCGCASLDPTATMLPARGPKFDQKKDRRARKQPRKRAAHGPGISARK